MITKPENRKRRRMVWILLALFLLFIIGSAAGIFIRKPQNTRQLAGGMNAANKPLHRTRVGLR